MTRRNLLVVGCGKRVVQTALPALARTDGSIALRLIAARSRKSIGVEGRTHEVVPLGELRASDIEGIDLLDPTKIVSILQEADKGIVLRYADLCHQVLQRDGHLFGVDRARRRSRRACPCASPPRMPARASMPTA